MSDFCRIAILKELKNYDEISTAYERIQKTNKIIKDKKEDKKETGVQIKKF